MMITQNISLVYLIPLAIEKLQVNILSEGDLYPGDLLECVLNSSPEYWRNHGRSYRMMYEMVKDYKSKIYENENIDGEIKNDLIKAINNFLSL